MNVSCSTTSAFHLSQELRWRRDKTSPSFSGPPYAPSRLRCISRGLTAHQLQPQIQWHEQCVCPSSGLSKGCCPVEKAVWVTVLRHGNVWGHFNSFGDNLRNHRNIWIPRPGDARPAPSPPSSTAVPLCVAPLPLHSPPPPGWVPTLGSGSSPTFGSVASLSFRQATLENLGFSSFSRDTVIFSHPGQDARLRSCSPGSCSLCR